MIRNFHRYWIVYVLTTQLLSGVVAMITHSHNEDVYSAAIGVFLFASIFPVFYLVWNFERKDSEIL
jgi:hypothetical protein